ncbi:MAG TPA: DUF1559 domain-containing protein [Gemmataceae bacterium]|nr:DUF1559 domain-containing protein [Gemmataceae bacterium]
MPPRRRTGFTLFQLLVVLAILAVLLGLLLPAVAKVREAAARAKDSNNMKQIAIAMHNINDTYGKMPPLAGPFPTNDKSMGTFYFYALPFIEQDNLYKKAGDGQGGFYVWNNATYAQVIQVYVSPQDRTALPGGRYQGWATTNYALNFQVFGDPAANTLQGSPRIPASFPDGTSNTLVIASRYQVCGDTPCAWGYYGGTLWAPAFAYQSSGKFQTMPPPGQCDPNLPQSLFPGGINVGMADGSVRFVSSQISPLTWWYATVPNDGMPLGADF